jgi:nucleotide-binding universal stress UspA family protein
LEVDHGQSIFAGSSHEDASTCRRGDAEGARECREVGAQARCAARGLGVSSEVRSAARSYPGIAVEVARHGRYADLIVLDAYGHSRMAEETFGGVTRDIIRTATVPLLMAR